MSVEYFLVCHKHESSVWTCSDGFSGPQLQCDRSFAAFVITHQGCDIKIVDENHFIDDPKYEKYTEWNKENWPKLLRYGLE